MLSTAGNPPRDVLAVLRAHAARAGGAIDRARRLQSTAAAIRADRAASCP